MVAIRKGSKKLRVPNSAYENYYKGFGWKLDDGQEIKKVSSKSETVAEELAQIDEDEEDWDSVVDEDEEVEKPLSEMNYDELKKKAASLGINPTGLNKRQLKDKIVNHSM